MPCAHTLTQQVLHLLGFTRTLLGFTRTLLGFTRTRARIRTSARALRRGLSSSTEG